MTAAGWNDTQTHASPTPAGLQIPENPDQLGPSLTPPVISGPIAASSLGGIPFIAINGPIHHFSGQRLAALVRGALEQAGCTIDVPE
ncbi:MAG: hypothetical protein PHQ28_00205 [Mycobacterium sp.]|nr:hypothetical protein [Mycobacterium sp.]